MFVNLYDVQVSSRAAGETVLGPSLLCSGGKTGSSQVVISEQRQRSRGLPLRLSLLPLRRHFLLHSRSTGHLPDPDSLDPCYLSVFSHLQQDLDWCFHLLKTTRTFAGKLSLESFQVIIAIYSLS